ncbi:hypothetical protein [Haloplasma contractile]|uniref:Uncharacterized protein n=1 Tax=Haloplasma contractile SSD-17B TaxID=1033810 RepID=U2FIY6_9MOLU|nr:hypothetical protein [Haloplasma contractile]ERJ11234.1 hypothetical protein HLPCO_002674 [Haloplasma contractile SSD-17B]
MSIKLFFYPTIKGFKVYSNSKDLNYRIKNKNTEDAVAFIKEKYTDQIITIEVYNSNNQLKKIKHYSN